MLNILEEFIVCHHFTWGWDGTSNISISTWNLLPTFYNNINVCIVASGFIELHRKLGLGCNIFVVLAYIICFFICLFLSTMQRNSRGRENPCEALKFQTEERIECMDSHKVKYTHREDLMLALPIPTEEAINKGE